MKIFIIILVSLVIFLIAMQVLNNKGTCLFGCHKTEDTHNQVNTYVNGKLVSSR